MASAREPDRELWRVAARQHGVVSRAQLERVGLTRSAVAHRLRTGRLWRLHRGVYAVGRPDLSSEGRWIAAVLACGPSAVLSHGSAAALWDLRAERSGSNHHVSVPSQSGRSPSRGRRPHAIVTHRCATLGAGDVTRRRGVPVTTLARTILDVAPGLGDRALRSVLREAEYRHRLDLGILRRSLDGAGSSSKHGRLRRALDVWTPGIGKTESELEAEFLALCARTRLPLPEVQQRIGRYRADFVWPDRALVVETDGYEAHQGRVAFSDDRAKDRALRAAGYAVLRFTWGEVVGAPDAVVRELRAALKQRRREPDERGGGGSGSLQRA